MYRACILCMTPKYCRLHSREVILIASSILPERYLGIRKWELSTVYSLGSHLELIGLEKAAAQDAGANDHERAKRCITIMDCRLSTEARGSSTLLAANLL